MKRAIPLVLLVVILGAYLAYKHYLAQRPFEWAGTVEARAVTVGSRAGGRVKTVLVREGDHVAAGQPLVELEPGDLEAQRAIARAQLAQAQAAYDKLKGGARPEEIEQAKARTALASAALTETRRGPRGEEIAAAQARLAQIQAQVDKAQLDAERARKLLASRAIPAAEAEVAETNLKATIAQRDAQKQVVDQLKAGARSEEKAQAAARLAEAEAAAKLVISGARVEDLRAADAQVAAAKARLDQLEVTIGELTVRAPSATRVESLDLRPGDLVAPNAPVATLLEDSQLFVRIYVPETELGRVKVGDRVQVHVDAFDRGFAGVIEHINARGEYSPRNLQTADERADQVFAIKIALVEGKDVLRAGMAAWIEVAR
ncbi:MAG TPA: HlyD family efflux transporter periplasmic adaptor subunit [Kofleriaceae bacterium]|nr:HlyD family efflux transporter periplasmic adaptor subunit [Kofleriaceae bacterium]